MVRHRGATLQVHTVGAGPATVVIPLRSWNEPRFAALASTHRVVFYDPRGRGRSSAVLNDDDYGIDLDLDDLGAVIDRVALGPVALIGTSYYGALVARFAMHHPARVSKLVLVGALYPSRRPYDELPRPEGNRPPPGSNEALRRLRERGRDRTHPPEYCLAYWRVEGPATVRDPSSLRRRRWPCTLRNEWPNNLARWTSGVFRSLGDWDWTEETRRLRMPILVLHGRYDQMVPLASSEAWATLPPRGTLHVLERAGHIPWWEVPDDIFPSVETFLRRSD